MSGTVAALSDSRARVGELCAVPTHEPAALIADALDANEHTRDRLTEARDTVEGEVPRRLVDTAIGRLARVHAQLTRALRDVEAAGGAS